MRYPIAIEPGNETQAFGVVVPDLPGCFSAGDNLDEAISHAKEAIELWLETVIEDGQKNIKVGFGPSLILICLNYPAKPSGLILPYLNKYC
jgi:predicted RNase H-like HicB family nuclease